MENQFQEQDNTLLAGIEEGMAVYDRENQQVGTVKDVYMRGGSDPADVQRQAIDTGVEPQDDATTLTPPPGARARITNRDDRYDDTTRGTWTVGGVGAVADVFATGSGLDKVPDAIRRRLENEGFIVIDSKGFFASDRYATPGQIAQVERDRIVLNVARDELAQG